MQETDLPTDSFVKLRLKLSVSLYYKLLDSIMRDEERKNADYGALQVKNELRNFCLVWGRGVDMELNMRDGHCIHLTCI